MNEAVLVAKMAVTSITASPDNKAGTIQQEQVRLHAVTGSDGSTNKQWSKWTPSGNLDLSISNPDAMGKVKPGFYKVFIVPCGEND